ncbi:MAG: asparagine synthase [Okeania sp. SIO2G4]|uniref:asparagine synthetase B family protein n=2 Tax=Microcoleaceae TaxID=1892252 RepID=UPI0013BA690C|nr:MULTISPECIES: asparagine synthetase B family protein [unclassified Okeania]NEP38655.1 asparagine synthase [Okeania sp. SIO2H7]NEP71463.1 asparagine synthase [Okeania sp. SIO2G5]NEP92211.1 asparagine synthase [Okeania sp. SIO2F5]NEQ89665.1 asparagine synthase [Okeania sp. SIO2G4]
MQYQFIGYWGYGFPLELNTILTKLTEEKKTKVFNFNQGITVGGISYIGGEEMKLARGETLIASLSASGLSDSIDAWVKLENNQLILGREPFGRVPLYWAKIEKVIWFASQFKLLLPMIYELSISIPGFYGYTCFSYVPTPLTPVENIFAVPAGTEQIFLEPEIQIQRRYDWRENSVQIEDKNDAITQLQTLLKNAINRQIIDLNYEPVGVFLSGGLDSSIVAALLVKAGIKVRAYTLDFGKNSFSEWEYAEKVAEHLDIPLVKVSVTPKLIKNALLDTVKALDLPFGDGVTVPLYLLCQTAAQEVSVIFNGEGGDQLFAGWTNKPIIAAAVYNRQENFIQRYLQTFHKLWGYEQKVFQPQIYEKVKNISAEKWIEFALDEGFCTGLIHKLRRASLILKGAQNIHPRATNLAFSNGLVVRSPFCDLELTEWTFQIPGEFNLKGSNEKYILKKAVESWLPPEVVWREKRGMGVPLSYWCLNELWSEIRQWLNPEVLQAEGRFISDIAITIIQGKLGGQIRNRRVGEILWLLMIWEIWRVTILGESTISNYGYNPLLLPPWWWRWVEQVKS